MSPKTEELLDQVPADIHPRTAALVAGALKHDRPVSRLKMDLMKRKIRKWERRHDQNRSH